MVIQKVKSIEEKIDQHWEMVVDCIDHWRRVNHNYYQSYHEIMNMTTYRINNEELCPVALTYHLEPNKW